MQYNKLYIKDMVCQRCILTVENIFSSSKIPFQKVQLGEVWISEKIEEANIALLQRELRKVGFDLIDTRIKQLVEKIKILVRDYLQQDTTTVRVKLSSYIGDHLNYDYSYLSDLFSSVEGVTIEKFLIEQRIEKVKELITYEQLSLTEIAYQTGFSSVHHLSAQFKKVTGLTPSHFKLVGAEKRKFLDRV